MNSAYHQTSLAALGYYDHGNIHFDFPLGLIIFTNY